MGCSQACLRTGNSILASWRGARPETSAHVLNESIICHTWAGPAGALGERRRGEGVIKAPSEYAGGPSGPLAPVSRTPDSCQSRRSVNAQKTKKKKKKVDQREDLGVVSVAVVVSTRRVNAHQHETERRESLGVAVIHHAGRLSADIYIIPDGGGAPNTVAVDS